MVYYLQMVFLEVYEDYSFVRKLAGGIMHVHMLELFLALACEMRTTGTKHVRLPVTGSRSAVSGEGQGYRFSKEELACLISIYDRRGRHNDDVAEGMYEKLYPVL